MAKLSNREVLWNKISRTVFQDRVVPYVKWRSAVMDSSHPEHSKILPQSLGMLSAATFVELIGEDEFVEKWNELRNSINASKQSVKNSTIILDNTWASIVTGFAFVKPNSQIKKPLSKKLRATFVNISRHSNPTNIYQVAKESNRAYNTVHADINKLEDLGLVKTQSVKINNRDVRLVESCAY
jgi:hypothetical protein